MREQKWHISLEHQQQQNPIKKSLTHKTYVDVNFVVNFFLIISIHYHPLLAKYNKSIIKNIKK